MKLLIRIFACVALSILAHAEERPLAEITFKVSDDFGNPVVGATIGMSTFHHWQPGEGFGKDISETFTGVTDENGLVTISGKSLTGDFAYGPRDLKGFYRGGGGSFRFKAHKDGKWQPWNPELEVIMKRIVNPIPMFAKKVGEAPYTLEIPLIGQPIGFDLMKGDWVVPHGTGITSDLVFKFSEEIPFQSVDRPFAASLEISFTNPLDGIQSVLAALDQGSELRLPRYAPEDGYQSKLLKQIGRPAADKPIDAGTREDQNYFIRVRTLMDEDGRIKSAYYGKLIGDVRFWGNRRVRFSYCLNPNPLDRNMEFDPKRNLFPNLPDSQQVVEP